MKPDFNLVSVKHSNVSDSSGILTHMASPIDFVSEIMTIHARSTRRHRVQNLHVGSPTHDPSTKDPTRLSFNNDHPPMTQSSKFHSLDETVSVFRTNTHARCPFIG